MTDLLNRPETASEGSRDRPSRHGVILGAALAAMERAGRAAKMGDEYEGKLPGEPS